MCDWSTTAWSVQSLWNFARIKSILRPIASNKKIIVSYFLWLDIAGSIFGNYAVVLQVLKRHHFQILTLLDILYQNWSLNYVQLRPAKIFGIGYNQQELWTVKVLDSTTCGPIFFSPKTYHVIYQNTSTFPQQLKYDGII